MLVLLLLLAYTAGVVIFGPRLVAGRSWTSKMPRLGLTVCLAVPVAALSGIALMATMTTFSVQHLRLDVGHLLHACAVAVWDSARHPSATVTAALGLVAGVLLWRVVRTGTASAASAHGVRRRQREGLGLVGCGERGYTLVPSRERFAYCLPGAGGRIVVSTAAKRELAEDQLAAVLAHERAHLRARHHALTQFTHVLAQAVPLPSMRALHAEVATLVEMAADDRACRESDPETLLGALLALGAPIRRPGLAANGTATLARAVRLADPAPHPPASHRAGLSAVAAALVVTPWMVGGLPVALALTGHCSG